MDVPGWMVVDWGLFVQRMLWRSSFSIFSLIQRRQCPLESYTQQPSPICCQRCVGQWSREAEHHLVQFGPCGEGAGSGRPTAMGFYVKAVENQISVIIHGEHSALW